jgi:hypothetical protein
MLQSGSPTVSSIGLDFGVLTLTTVILIVIAARLYPRLAQ